MSNSYKSLRINAPKGQKVIFKGERDGLCGGGHANDQLKEGAVYTVDKTRISRSWSMATLKEFPVEEFNTAMFEEAGEHLEVTHEQGRIVSARCNRS